MFDKRSAQVEILRNMFNAKRRPAWFEIDGKIAITTNGFYAYIFDSDEVFINLAKMQKVDYNMKSDSITPDHKLHLTKVVYERNPGMTQRVFVCQGGERVVVNEDFLRQFKNCEFYGDGALSPVFCTDGLSGLCGVILPIRSPSDLVERELNPA